MSFNEQNLPYATNHLEPVISERTIDFHFGKHQKGYAEKLTLLINGTPFENMDLISIIKETAFDNSKTAIFNNAAQLWNHIFYWDNLAAFKESNPIPDGNFREAVKVSFGDENTMKEKLLDASVNLFGSGWAWLVLDPKNGALTIIKTQNAGNPLTADLIPLLTLDVWEHAYYLDYQNRRQAYAKNLIENIMDWHTVNERYDSYLDKSS